MAQPEVFIQDISEYGPLTEGDTSSYEQVNET
jgi:hypothetical protein